jgi:hypothetical protein
MVSLSGFPAAPGTAPPDFNAITAAPVTQQQMIIEWWKTPTPAGNPQPFTNVTSTGPTSPGPNLTLDGTVSTLSRHVLLTGPTSQDLNTLTAYPTIVTTDGTTIFTVGNTVNGVYIYSKIADFETEVAKLMAAGTSTAPLTFSKLVAEGQYDATTNTFNATRVTLAAVQ